jgi:hypothetical protein
MTPSKRIRHKVNGEDNDEVSKANTPLKICSGAEDGAFKDGALVWAKVEGFTSWPATIRSPKTAAQVIYFFSVESSFTLQQAYSLCGCKRRTYLHSLRKKKP